MFKKFHPMNRGALLLVSWLIAGAAQAATFNVTNTGAGGAGSLRQALLDANTASGPDVIVFDAAVTGTISLSSPLPVVTDDLVIQGPGAEVLNLSGDNSVRVFAIAAGIEAIISGLQISNGLAADNGSPGNGGGISNRGDLTLRNCRIVNNSAASGLGGGIDNLPQASLWIERCVISGNRAENGGGIANDGTLVLIDSSVIDNDSMSLGGGIDNAGVATVVRSLVAGNSGHFGGGIATGVDPGSESSGELLIANSTISGNTAAGEFASGGGVDNFEGVVELLHATIARNQAHDGAGVWTNSEFLARNSLVADNTGNDCEFALGSFDVSGVNFDTDGTCPNFTTVSPSALALGDLADNGGETLTHALGSTSAARDAALDCTALDGVTAVPEDQRGASRPQGNACDAGAFEAEVNDLVFADGFE